MGVFLMGGVTKSLCNWVKICFGPNIVPRASFGVNMGVIDAENLEELDNRAPNARKS